MSADLPAASAPPQYGTIEVSSAVGEYTAVTSPLMWRNPVWVVVFGVNLIVSSIFAVSKATELDLEKFAADDPAMKAVYQVVLTSAFVSAAVAFAFAVFWIMLVRRQAFLVIHAAFAGVAAIGVIASVRLVKAEAASPGAMIPLCILFELGLGLYFYHIRDRIPFASELLAASAKCLETYHAQIGVAFASLFVNALFTIFYFLGAFVAVVKARGLSSFLFWYLAFSSLWFSKLSQNVVHVISSGVNGHFFFSSELRSPIKAAFHRATTTSFGSVIYASFIQVAFLLPLRYFERVLHYSLVFRCWSAVLQRWIRIFTEFPLSYVSIFGGEYSDAAMKTYKLFKAQGIEALVNDRVTRLATSMGIRLGGLLSTYLGVEVAKAIVEARHDRVTVEDGDLFHIVVTVIVGIIVVMNIGYTVVRVAFQPLNSGISTFFICWAEDSAAIANARPELYEKIVTASAGRLKSIKVMAALV